MKKRWIMQDDPTFVDEACCQKSARFYFFVDLFD
jgi:hypothetical protein